MKQKIHSVGKPVILLTWEDCPGASHPPEPPWIGIIVGRIKHNWYKIRREYDGCVVILPAKRIRYAKNDREVKHGNH